MKTKLKFGLRREAQRHAALPARKLVFSSSALVRTKAVSPLRSATAVQNLAVGLFCVLMLFPGGRLAAQTNRLTALLQQGLFEEQASRNLPAAISNYQALATQFDQDRQLAATAVFRIGECYRMEGRTNEAAAQYQRILKDFSDQTTLATLSRQNLVGMGFASSNAGNPSDQSNETSPEARSLAARIFGLEKLKSDPEEQARGVLAIFPDDVLEKMLTQLPKLQEQVDRVKANPQLPFRTWFTKDEDFSAVGSDGKLTRGIFMGSGTNLDLLANGQRELNTQLSSIEQRVNFILGIQKARLKVLQAASGAEAKDDAVQNGVTPIIPDEETQEIQRIQTMIQNSPDLINAVSDGNTPLGNAAAHGWLRVAAFLLAHGADVNGGYGSPLFSATRAGNRAMVELLLSRGANVNADTQDTEGNTPLHLAAQKGFQAVVEVLLANKADVNAKTRSGYTPLFWAAQMNSSKIVALLIEHKADVNAQNSNGETPLIVATDAGQLENVKLLLAAGANPNAVSNDGRTSLSYAAEHGSTEMVKLLLDAKADPSGGTLDAPLLVAIHKNDTNSAELLLQAGANPNAKGDVDWQPSRNWHVVSLPPPVMSTFLGSATPLWLAIATKQFPMVQLLLKYKADPNDLQPDGRPLFFNALVNPDILKALLAAGAEVNFTDGQGRTVLNYALGLPPENLPTEIMPALLDAGANPNTEDSQGRTPLSYAVEKDGSEIVKLLLAAKADPNGGKLDVPLLAAIYKNDTNSAELLLQAGANPNVYGAVDSGIHIGNTTYGRHDVTPLWLAVYMKQLPLVQLLLKYKADPNDSQTDGRSLLFSALGNPDILNALLDAGAKVDARDETVISDNPILKRTALMMAASGANNSNAVAVLLQHGADANARDSQGRTALLWAACNAPADESVFALLLNAKADPNVRDNGGQTPLSYLKIWLRNDWKSRFSTVAAAHEYDEKLIALLHQHGALDKLPDWDHITVSRPAANFSQTVFQQGTNDWNQFTLLETIFNFYLPLPDQSIGATFAERLKALQNANNNIKLPFPDLAHVTIVRPSHDSTNETRIEVNLLNSTNGIDCGKDVALQFGDVVEISERDHALGDSPVGLTRSHQETIADCLSGKVQLVTHGQKVELPLYPNAYGSLLTSVIGQSAAQNVLLSSSDLSRVKVIRHDAKTGKQQEWIVDCSDKESPANGNPPNFHPPNSGANHSSLATGLWLRDGDVIEVPEK